MTSITNYKSVIVKCDVRKQRINVPETSTWVRILNHEFPIVQDIDSNLNQDKDGRYILRGDVMDSKSPQEMIIRALIWAYPLGNFNIRGLRHIITNIDNIAQALNGWKGTAFADTVFLQRYNSLCGIPGIGPSTASILMYFFNIQLTDGNKKLRAVAVTKPMKEATVNFDELLGFDNLLYIEQIQLIHRVANQIKPATFDMLELFLHEY